VFWTSRVAVKAVLVALSVTLGLLLVSVPNVELLTFSIFVSGAVLGRSAGALVGALSWAVFSAVNPMGTGLGFPPMFVAQIVSGAITGFAGGVSAPLWRVASARATGTTEREGAAGTPQGAGAVRPRAHRVALVALAAALGLTITVVYQGAVILGLAIASPELRTGVMAAIASNAFFSAVHVVSNTIVFAVLGPIVIPRLSRLVGRGTRG